MDFSDTEEEAAFRQQVRVFLEGNAARKSLQNGAIAGGGRAGAGRACKSLAR